MPAYVRPSRIVRPRERASALAAVVLVQAILAAVLFRGLHMDVSRSGEVVQRLVDITLPKPPPPPVVVVQPKPRRHQSAAPKAEPVKPGGSPGQQSAHSPPSVTPIVPVNPSAAPSGGGVGTGPALGVGAGGGPSGNGYGNGEGGSDLEQIAGDITPRDYPRELRSAGIGGRVYFSFRVEPTGRVSRCTITRSSGVPQLDALTCRLVQQRFLYQPSTDRNGRPIADEVEGEHDWVTRGR